MIVSANTIFFRNDFQKRKLPPLTMAQQAPSKVPNSRETRSLMKTVYFLSSSNLSIRLFISIVALVTAALCGAEPISSPSASPPGNILTDGCLVPGYDDHCERWVSVYDNRNGHNEDFSANGQLAGLEEARGQVISPQGDVVYVTGYSWDNTTQAQQFATVAFDVDTGARLWVARHGGPGIISFAYDIAVSPDGSRIYVGGQQYRYQQGTQFSEATTIAYDAATGRQLWLARYREPFAGASADHVVVSPDGARVYVSGADSAGGDFGRNVQRYLTIAYSASTGSQEWVAFHDNPELQDSPDSLVLGPRGARLYVAGGGGLVAYDAATGEQLWETADPNGSLSISPDGSQLFGIEPFGGGAALVAYAAATGRTSWSTPLPPVFGIVRPVVGPKGARVYLATTQDVTGPNDLSQNIDAVTMAFDAKSGGLAWTADYNDARFPARQEAKGLAVSPDGKRLYLASRSPHRGRTESGISEINTVAYDAADGAQKWVGSYRASPEDFDALAQNPGDPIVVTPDGSKVIVAGSFNHHPFGRPNELYPNNLEDYALLAYDTQLAPGVRALKAVSRKVHGKAGTFDLVGIECRSGGPNNRYQMVVTFPSAVTFRGAAITSGTGSVASTSTDGTEVTVNLTGVADAQTITLTLSDVSDGTHTNDVALALSVLVGDLTAGGSVSLSEDLSQVYYLLGQPFTMANFRADVTTNGLIGNADFSLVEAKLGNVLP